MNTFILIFLVPLMVGVALALFGIVVDEEPLKFFGVMIPIACICTILNSKN